MFDCFWLSVPVQLIAWKDSSPNDLLCVEWDVKPYTLTHSHTEWLDFYRKTHHVNKLWMVMHSGCSQDWNQRFTEYYSTAVPLGCLCQQLCVFLLLILIWWLPWFDLVYICLSHIFGAAIDICVCVFCLFTSHLLWMWRKTMAIRGISLSIIMVSVFLLENFFQRAVMLFITVPCTALAIFHIFRIHCCLDTLEYLHVI